MPPSSQTRFSHIQSLQDKTEQGYHTSEQL